MPNVPVSPERVSPFHKLVRPILYLVLGATAAFCGLRVWQTYKATAADPAFDNRILQGYGLSGPGHHSLDSAFRDANADLLADPPTDPAQFVDPAQIAIAHINSDDGNSETVDWDAFTKSIGTAAGKPSTMSAFDDARGLFEPIRAGTLPVLVVHAADTPYLVNHFGFIPFAVVGDDRGLHGHRMDIIVPAGSSIAKPQDIRNHDLLCTQPLSIVGYRAAVAYLHETFQLRPDFDYKIVMSFQQRDSIESICKGQAQVACVSSDKLESMLKAGDVKAGEYQTLYESEVIPRYVAGYFYNLKPELAAKIRAAVLAFVNPGEERKHPLRFVAIDYRKDFQTVRAIDDAFESRLLLPPKSSTPAAAAATEAAATEPATKP